MKRSRASTEQLSKMVDFMFDNPGLASKNFQRLHGKFEWERKWSEITVLLNSFDGARKTMEQWHTVWRDMKSRTCIKLREREKQASTGNNHSKRDPITNLEKRVIAVIGGDCIVDDDKPVFENVPFKELHETSSCDEAINEPNKEELEEEVGEEEEEVMNMPMPFFQKEKRDSFEYFGLAWAAKLRKMKPMQSKIAERLISEVLFQGDVGLLTLDTKIQNKITISTVTSSGCCRTSTPRGDIHHSVNQLTRNCQRKSCTAPSTSQDLLAVTQSETIMFPTSQEPNTEFIKEEACLQEQDTIL